MLEKTSGIVGIGAYVPDKVLTNFDLEKMVDTSDEWIRTRTGIRERRIAPDSMTTSDMAVEASKQALEMAGVKPTELDLILCATVTPDQPLPATAAFIQHRLGATNAAGFDMAAACAGFLYALTTAHQFIVTGYAKRILIIGVELLSRHLDWEDRRTCVLFGDGAGAAVISPVDKGGYVAGRMYLDGSLAELICQPAGGTRIPITQSAINEKLHKIKMRGNEVFRIAVRYMGRAMKEVMEEAGVTPEDIDWVVPHQANERITQALTDYLGFPGKKVYSNIERYGNTSAASIPIALREMVDKDLLKAGQLVAMTALGGGIAYAANLIRWSI